MVVARETPDSLLTTSPLQKSPCAQKLQVLPYERMYGILQTLQFFEKVGDLGLGSWYVARRRHRYVGGPHRVRTMWK